MENKIAKIYAGATAAVLIGTIILVAHNRNDNSKTVTTAAHTTASSNVNVLGHKEYTVFRDGSREVRRYPSSNLGSYVECRDMNGDGLTDRIVVHNNNLRQQSLKYILERGIDYMTHTDDFDKCDAEMHEGSARLGR